MAEIWTMGELLVEIMRPEPGTPLYKEGIFRGPFPSGAPGIFISTAARLGHSAGIIGGVGNDDFGKNILERLKRDGVDTSYVLESDNNSTGVAFVTYFENGDRQFIFHMGNTPAVEAKAPNPSEMAGAKLFHIMGCSLMADTAFAREILKTMYGLKEQGARVSFDPNIRPELMRDPAVNEIMQEVLENTDIFLPGVQELLNITGEVTAERAVQKCLQYPSMEMIVLKDGARGAQIHTQDGRTVQSEAFRVKSIDPTGAGDSFDAAFLCGLLEGRSPKEAGRMAAAAGALNVMAFGPMEGNISPETVREMMEKGRIF